MWFGRSKLSQAKRNLGYKKTKLAQQARFLLKHLDDDRITVHVFNTSIHICVDGKGIFAWRDGFYFYKNKPMVDEDQFFITVVQELRHAATGQDVGPVGTSD